MKAIVVDDSRAMRMMLRKMLAETGFEVVEAGHGIEALARLDEVGALDLALIDWNMPELDGVGLVRAIRARPQYSGMRLMMVTSETDASRVQGALEAGANEYMMKPFTADALAAKLCLLGLR